MEGAVSPVVLRNKGVPIRLYQLDEQGDILEDAEGNPLLTEHYLRFTAGTSRDLEVDPRWDGREFPTNVPVLVDGQQQYLRGPDGSILETDDGKPLVQTEVRLQPYYGQNAWAMAMEGRTTGTVIATIALALRLPDAEVERSLVDGQLGEYAAAVQTAWAMAQGLESEAAGKVLRKALGQVSNAKQEMVTELARQLGGTDDDSDSASEPPAEPQPQEIAAAPAPEPSTTSLGGTGGEPGSQVVNAAPTSSGT